KLPAGRDGRYTRQPERLDGVILVNDMLELAKLSLEIGAPIPNRTIVAQRHRMVAPRCNSRHITQVEGLHRSGPRQEGTVSQRAGPVEAPCPDGAVILQG